MTLECLSDVGLDDRAGLYQSIVQVLMESPCTMDQLMDRIDDPENRSRHTVKNKLADLKQRSVIDTKTVGTHESRKVYYYVLPWDQFKREYYDRVRRSFKRNLFNPVQDRRDDGTYFGDL